MDLLLATDLPLGRDGQSYALFEHSNSCNSAESDCDTRCFLCFELFQDQLDVVCRSFSCGHRLEAVINGGTHDGGEEEKNVRLGLLTLMYLTSH